MKYLAAFLAIECLAPLLPAVAAKKQRDCDTARILMSMTPNCRFPLVGRTKHQFFYLSRALAGDDLTTGDTLVSTTHMNSLVASNQKFSLPPADTLAVEAELWPRSQLIDGNLLRNRDWPRDFFHGASYFGALGDRDDWQFVFYIVNETVYAVLAYLPLNDRMHVRDQLNFAYAVPVRTRCPKSVSSYAVVLQQKRRTASWYIDGCLVMRVSEPARLGQIAGKFMFAQRPGQTLDQRAFPCSIRAVIGNIEPRTLYGMLGMGDPHTACQNTTVCASAPSALATRDSVCEYAGLPPLDSFDLMMRTTVHYVLVVQLKCQESYEEYFALNACFRERFGCRQSCPPEPCSSSSSSCSSSSSGHYLGNMDCYHPVRGTQPCL